MIGVRVGRVDGVDGVQGAASPWQRVYPGEERGEGLTCGQSASGRFRWGSLHVRWDER